MNEWIDVIKQAYLRKIPFNRFVIVFLPRSKYLLISWLQSLSAMILEPKKKSVTASTFFPSRWYQRGPNGELEFSLPPSSKEATLLSVVSEEATWGTPRTDLYSNLDRAISLLLLYLLLPQHWLSEAPKGLIFQVICLLPTNLGKRC